jgi:hypothetical protein
MFIFNKSILFFLLTRNFLFSFKTEIKFQINNVPSLFRCEKNGALFYFNHFPNHDEFHQSLLKRNLPCDLVVSSIDQHAIIELERLELLCEILHTKKHANEFLFFSTKCSTDLCRRSLPSTATIITEYNTGDVNKDQIDFIVQVNQSTRLILGQLRYSVRGKR